MKLNDKEFNWAVFKDNEPKYKVGDLILHYSSTCGIVTDVIKKAFTAKEKQYKSEHISRQRPCCSKNGRGVLCDNFAYSYKVGSQIIPELEILGCGVEAINIHMAKLKKSNDSLSKQIEQAADALGY